ncbi:MAG: hypothetical protein A3E78_11790 [Alphaproteobacteria bacterium RIFCSPHIGHO2_12_FULL_63_12]|nr:MAG: hypothetical protein A3E78_11790 [Alphaproteobacteria bacterium RIFCSPHIGHO2_12_FULL_63_12]
MTGILADLCLQVGSLALVFGGTIGVLAALEIFRRAVDDWRADRNVKSASGRIGLDQARGVAERLSIADMHERRLEEQARRSRNIRTRSSARLETAAGSGGPASHAS